MADKYQVAINHDNEAGLTDILPEPAMPKAPSYPEFAYDGDGGASPNGWLQGELVWNELLERADRAAILTQLGLSETTPSGKITIRCRKPDDTFGNYNAIAIAPQESQRSMFGWSDFRIKLNKMELLP